MSDSDNLLLIPTVDDLNGIIPRHSGSPRNDFNPPEIIISWVLPDVFIISYLEKKQGLEDREFWMPTDAKGADYTAPFCFYVRNS